MLILKDNEKVIESRRDRRNRVLPGIVSLMVLVFLLLLPASLTAYGASGTGTAVIPVRQTVSNGNGEFTYSLIPEDASAPMPSGTVNGVYEFPMAGSNVSKSITIESTSAGTWYYTLKVKNPDNRAYTSDVNSYRIGVKFYRNSDGVYSEVSAIAADPAGEYKSSEVDFKITARMNNKGDVKPTKTKESTVKTGDETPIGTYVAVMACTAGVLIVLLAYRRRKENENAAEGTEK